ncbi:MAG TPA: FAD-dependent oxidoreductase, partial [Solirubrobacteraceae bacterium]
EAEEFGLKVSGVEVDYVAVQARRAKVVSTLTSGVGGLFKKDGIDVIEGNGKLTADTPQGGTGGDVLVDVFDSEPLTIAAGSVILATGSTPRPIPGVQFGGRVIGTEEAWALPEVPARLAVVGAGASGAEIASAYARLGSEVLLLEALDRLLPTEDADISRLVERGLKRQGIAVHTSTPVADVKGGESSVSFSYGSESTEVDYLVICAGRGADVEGLGLAEAGVELSERGLIQVDGALRTSRAGVYAIGDLVPGPALAHKASDEGVIAAETIAGRPTHPIVYQDIPRATFCTPNVGSFGLTEAQAREQGYDVVVGKVPYGAVGGGTVYGDRTGLVKVVGESKYGELLGGHIVGARATELIQELVNVRALEGGFPELARIIHGHPTLSEAVMEAGRAADGWLIHG